MPYIDFLKRKLVEWYAFEPKSDSHAPVQEDNGVSKAGEEGQGVVGQVSEIQLINKPLLPDFKAKEDRLSQTHVEDEKRLHLIRTWVHLNRIGAAFDPARTHI